MIIQIKMPGMHIAGRKEKTIVLDIINKAFKNDPALSWMTELSKNKKKKKFVMEYLVEETYSKGTVYITDDNSGVALWQGIDKKRVSLKLLLYDILMLFRFNFPSLIRLLKFKGITKKQFLNNAKYCYLATIAVLPKAQGKGLASRLMNPVLELCRKKDIPVFLETANVSNVEIYQSKGFCTTDVKNFNSTNFYFMKTA
jgi:ribosomal protein S18 acetylase RimI-like enzyme